MTNNVLIDCYYFNGLDAYKKSGYVEFVDGGINFFDENQSKSFIKYDNIKRSFLSELNEIRFLINTNLKIEIILPIFVLNKISEKATFLLTPPKISKEHIEKVKKLGFMGWGIIIAIFIILPLLARPILNLIPTKLEAQLGESFFKSLEVSDMFSNDYYAKQIGKYQIKKPIIKNDQDYKERQIYCAKNENEDNICEENIFEYAKLYYLGTEIYIRANQIAKNQNIEHKIKISLVDEDIFNAFALPGGHLIFYCGLINKIDADQFSFILGHEIAHVKNRDSMEKYIENLGATLLSSFLNGAGSTSSSEFAIKMKNLSYSRKLEERADFYGAKMLMDNGYSPNGGPKTFDTFIKEGHNYRFAIDNLFASHPAPEIRKQKLEMQIENKTGKKFLSDEDFKTLRFACNNN